MTKVKWNEVTWYSRAIALVLFIALPFLGFYLGVLYGRLAGFLSQQLQQANRPVAVSASTLPEYYKNVAEWQADNNTTGGWSIAYPIDFAVNDDGTAAPVSDWRTGVPGGSGRKLFTLTIPKAFEPQTNFAEAALAVGASGNAGAIAQCMVPEMTDGAMATSTVAINGTDFTVFHFSDAGAGNLYDTTSYRTLHAGECYAVEYTIHSTQIANYPSSYGLRAFDESRVKEVLDRIVGTFRFQ